MCQAVERVGLLGAWHREQQTAFCAMVQDLILATDIELHADFVQQLSGLVESLNSSLAYGGRRGLQQREGNLGEGERRLLMKWTLKFSDLANITRPLQMANAWATRIQEEVFNQRQVEIQMGYPPGEQPHRRLTFPEIMNHQHYFATHKVQPLLRLMMNFLDDACVEEIWHYLEMNIGHWEQGDRQRMQRVDSRTNLQFAIGL